MAYASLQRYRTAPSSGLRQQHSWLYNVHTLALADSVKHIFVRDIQGIEVRTVSQDNKGWQQG
jgi:hypothetical protein